MDDLFSLSTKELRNIAKEKKVKNYWLLGKTDLIAGITANDPSTAEIRIEKPEEKPEAPAKAKRLRALNKQTFEYDGKSQSLRAWATELDMEYNTLYDRINRLHWDVEKALSTPCKVIRKVKEKAHD